MQVSIIRHVPVRAVAGAAPVRHSPLGPGVSATAAENHNVPGARIPVIKNLLACKPVDQITRAAESGPGLNRVLGVRALTSIGLGSMIGSGVFALSGTVAAEHTGPAVTLAFLIAAVGCG